MGRKRAQMDVTLKLLLDTGNVRPGNGVLHVSTRDQTRHADLHEDGMITFEGVRHRSLSSFAVAAIRSCGAVGRKTANGWQVVSYRGRPLELYRSDYLEKQSQDSEGSRDVEAPRTLPKMRRTTLRSPSDAFVKAGWKEIELDEVVRSSDSGGSEAAVFKRPLWTKTLKRVRPSRTWLDAVRQNGDNGRAAPGCLRCVDATMKLEKATMKTEREEEGEVKQELEVSMWLKKALNKRHREECGLS